MISDGGVRRITLGMSESPALRLLNLSGNPFQSEGAKHVTLMLMEPRCQVSRSSSCCRRRRRRRRRRRKYLWGW